MTSTEPELPPREWCPETGRYIQRVRPWMVAAARAQMTIAEKLGEPVPPAIRKIAALDRS